MENRRRTSVHGKIQKQCFLISINPIIINHLYKHQKRPHPSVFWLFIYFIFIIARFAETHLTIKISGFIFLPAPSYFNIVWNTPSTQSELVKRLSAQNFCKFNNCLMGKMPSALPACFCNTR